MTLPLVIVLAAPTLTVVIHVWTWLLGNLPTGIKHVDLLAFLGKIADVESLYSWKDRSYAFAKLKPSSSLDSIIGTLNGSSFQGNVIYAQKSFSHRDRSGTFCFETATFGAPRSPRLVPQLLPLNRTISPFYGYLTDDESSSKVFFCANMRFSGVEARY